jgi:hypothetical protein
MDFEELLFICEIIIFSLIVGFFRVGSWKIKLLFLFTFALYTFSLLYLNYSANGSSPLLVIIIIYPMYFIFQLIIMFWIRYIYRQWNEKIAMTILSGMILVFSFLTYQVW